jgi:5-methylcytosine-specific restriction endonuclease McrA
VSVRDETREAPYQLADWRGTSNGMLRVWDCSLPPIAKLVLIRFADSPGTVTSCAEWAGLTLAETQGIVDRLIFAGWLEPWSQEPEPSPLLQDLIDRDGRSCRHCGTEANLTIDHIFPRALGGGDEMENLQVLCGPCNSRKGARVP